MKNLFKQEQTIATIDQTFMKLIVRKPLEEIRVTDICRTCGISRPTFYTYYQDVTVLHDIVEDKILDECMKDFHAVGMLLKGPERFFNEFNRCFKGKSRILSALARGRQDEQDLKIVRMLVKAGRCNGGAAEETCLTMLVSGLLTIQKQYRSSVNYCSFLGRLQGAVITISYSNDQASSRQIDQPLTSDGSLILYTILDNPKLIGTH